MARDKIDGALLRLSRTLPTPEQSRAALRGLRPHALRGAAVIAAAQLDFALFIGVASRLRPLADGDLYLFENDGPYATTMQKIDACYSLGIIGSHSKREMKTLVRIRNAFSHATVQVTFATEAIENAVNTLQTIDLFPEFHDRKQYKLSDFPWGTTKEKYVTAVKIYGERLIRYYEETRNPFTKVSDGLATMRLVPEALP